MCFFQLLRMTKIWHQLNAIETFFRYWNIHKYFFKACLTFSTVHFYLKPLESVQAFLRAFECRILEQQDVLCDFFFNPKVISVWLSLAACRRNFRLVELTQPGHHQAESSGSRSHQFPEFSPFFPAWILTALSPMCH